MSNNSNIHSDSLLAASITRAASKQSYYTIRYLVDRDLIADAYRTYAYFRWVDDLLDQNGMERSERLTFVERQKTLVNQCYINAPSLHVTDEETMLVDLIRNHPDPNSGLQSYIQNMMAVMAFDADRRGRLISKEELSAYTRHLAVAVTEALHYFIGHGSKSPQDERRYLAVTAAHITHMLRDTLEDAQAGYFNIPREYIETHRIDPCDVWSDPYRKWIKNRVGLARACFKSGCNYFARVENLRFRVAGYAYTCRFDGVLDAIERDDYRLRSGYPECKSLSSGMKMIGSALSMAFNYHPKVVTAPLPMRRK